MADRSALAHNRASAWGVSEVHDPGPSNAAPALPVLNRILARMPPDAFEDLRPHLERVPIRRRAILQEQHRPIEHVYFIERGVASIFARTRQDGPVEVSLVGRFGLVGVSAILGAMRSPHRCLMQMDGEALRVPAATLARVMNENPAVRGANC